LSVGDQAGAVLGAADIGRHTAGKLLHDNGFAHLCMSRTGLTNLILDFPLMFPGAAFRTIGTPDLLHDVANSPGDVNPRPGSARWAVTSASRSRASTTRRSTHRTGPAGHHLLRASHVRPATAGGTDSATGATNSSRHGLHATATPGKRPGGTSGLQPKPGMSTEKAPTQKVDDDGSQYAARGERLPGRTGHSPGDHRAD
jgi:hypothetical protein